MASPLPDLVSSDSNNAKRKTACVVDLTNPICKRLKNCIDAVISTVQTSPQPINSVPIKHEDSQPIQSTTHMSVRLWKSLGTKEQPNFRTVIMHDDAVKLLNSGAYTAFFLNNHSNLGLDKKTCLITLLAPVSNVAMPVAFYLYTKTDSTKEKEQIYTEFFQTIKALCPNFKPVGALGPFDDILKSVVRQQFEAINYHADLYHLIKINEEHLQNVLSRPQLVKYVSPCLLALWKSKDPAAFEQNLVKFKMLWSDQLQCPGYYQYFITNWKERLSLKALRNASFKCTDVMVCANLRESYCARLTLLLPRLSQGVDKAVIALEDEWKLWWISLKMRSNKPST